MPIARLFHGNHLDTLCLDRPFSNFAFVEKFTGGNTALRRIFSQTRRSNCHTLIIEDIEGADDIVQENEDLAAHPGIGPIRTTTENSTERLFDSFVMTRLPGYFALYNEETSNFSFIPSGIDDHVELFGQEENGA